MDIALQIDMSVEIEVTFQTLVDKKRKGDAPDRFRLNYIRFPLVAPLVSDSSFICSSSIGDYLVRGRLYRIGIGVGYGSPLQS